MNVAVFGVALALHALMIADGPRDPTWSRPIVDARTYRDLARVLLSPRFEPNTPFYQPPGFAYLLTGIHATLGRDPTTGRWALAVMGALTALFACRIASRLFRPRTGLIAGLLTAACGPLLFYNLQWLPAGLAALLNTLLLWLLLDAVARDRTATWLIVGGCAGLAAITVPNVLLFMPLTPAWLLWVWTARRPRRAPGESRFRRIVRCLPPVAGRTILLAVGTLSAIAPVTWKNYRASGRFALISHNGGLNFYIGNNPACDETIAIRPGFAWESLDKLPMRAGVYAFSVALFFVAARYRVVFLPGVCILAAAALDAPLWLGRGHRALGAAAMVLLAVNGT